MLPRSYAPANATYTLLYGNTSLNVTNEYRRTITDIRSDTTFYLIGSVGTGTEEVKRILSTGVMVIKPDLEIGNLVVHGTVTAKDDISIEAGKKLVTPEISATGGSVKISSSVDHTNGTVKLLDTGALEVNGRVKVKGGIEGDSAAGKPLEVHQTAGLNVHANLQVGTSGGNYTAVFKKPVTVENTLSVSEGNPLKTNKLTTVSGGTISVDKHIDMTKGTILRTGDLRGVDDGANKTIKVNAPIDFTATVDIVKAAKRGKLSKGAAHSFTADTSGLLVIHAWAGDKGSTAGTEVYVNNFPHGRFMTYADHSNGQPGGELLTIPLKRDDRVEFKVVNRRGTSAADLAGGCGSPSVRRASATAPWRRPGPPRPPYRPARSKAPKKRSLTKPSKADKAVTTTRAPMAVISWRQTPRSPPSGGSYAVPPEQTERKGPGDGGEAGQGRHRYGEGGEAAPPDGPAVNRDAGAPGHRVRA